MEQEYEKDYSLLRPVDLEDRVVEVEEPDGQEGVEGGAK